MSYLIIAIVSLTVVALGRYKQKKQMLATETTSSDKFYKINDLVNELKQKGDRLTEKEVFPYASNFSTREQTYQLLKENGRVSLFPQEYLTIIRGAESNLANWLEFPTELDACPDEIEHVKRVTIPFDDEGNLVHYEVFKYMVFEPHWAAADGWMLGVVGPYFDDTTPYDFPRATFSRMNSVSDAVTPEEEAKWVHENIAMRE